MSTPTAAELLKKITDLEVREREHTQSIMTSMQSKNREGRNHATINFFDNKSPGKTNFLGAGGGGPR